VAFGALLKKYPIEAAIVAGIVILLLVTIAYPMFRTTPETPAAPPQAAVPLLAPPPLAGLRADAEQVPYSIDSVAQGSQSTIVAGKTTAVALPFTVRQPIVVNGWAADHTKPAAGVYVLIDGVKRVPATYGIDRPDVARVLGIGDGRVGFAATIPAGALGDGVHTIKLLIVANGGRFYYAERGRATIQLTN
jgi:hypothetical protein